MFWNYKENVGVSVFCIFSEFDKDVDVAKNQLRIIHTTWKSYKKSITIKNIQETFATKPLINVVISICHTEHLQTVWSSRMERYLLPV